MEFIIGILVGLLLYYVFGKRKHISGIFIIDFSDPKKDICRLELHDSLNDIYEMNQIILKVKRYDTSQD